MTEQSISIWCENWGGYSSHIVWIVSPFLCCLKCNTTNCHCAMLCKKRFRSEWDVCQFSSCTKNWQTRFFRPIVAELACYPNRLPLSMYWIVFVWDQSKHVNLSGSMVSPWNTFQTKLWFVDGMLNNNESFIIYSASLQTEFFMSIWKFTLLETRQNSTLNVHEYSSIDQNHRCHIYTQHTHAHTNSIRSHRIFAHKSNGIFVIGSSMH